MRSDSGSASLAAGAGEPPRPEGRIGLSGRLLLLTIGFVMLAEVLIYVPSIANFRRNWLNDRLVAAQTAALVVEASPEGLIPPDLVPRLLQGIGARAVAVKVQGSRQLLSASPMPPEVSRTVDLREASPLELIWDALVLLVAGAHADPIRVVGGPGAGDASFVELVIDEGPLRAAMLVFSRNILVLSLIISAITAGLVYLALHLMIVRPVRRMAAGVTAFERDPEDASRIIAPSARDDEIGLAERAIARMQATLATELRQKKHLAALGLAVSKINHDLRNMLAAAQLMSDRLSEVDDPAARRFAPRLIATLDRAIGFCQATLSYGRAAEPLPQRRPLSVAALAEDLRVALGLEDGGPVRFRTDIAEGLTVDADPDQMARVLLNLGRNAVQALTQAGASDGEPTLLLAGRREGAATVLVVSDNGPGLPAKARANLFEAFQGAARAGGTGLGLAIAAELVRLHGGAIQLEDGAGGATFRILVPDAAPPL